MPRPFFFSPVLRFLFLTLALALCAAPLTAHAENLTHTVQSGETLFRIGLRYGVNWRDIMTANGLYSTTIYPGQVLIIPGGTPAAPAPASAPAVAPAAPGAAAGHAYVVQRGDTLLVIAQRHHLSLDELLRANALASPDRIYAGQVLAIPGAIGRWLAVTGHAQALPLDCESRSAVDYAAYFGVTIGELEFFGRLPASDDPDTGFVGNVYGRWGQTPPNPYGVNAGPIAALLRDYGVNARAATGLDWESVRAEIDQGRPVIVWVAGHVGYGTSMAYTASNGHTTLVAPYEHTVIIAGYGLDAVTVLDGAATYTRSLAQFLASWGALGNQAVLAQ